MSCWPGGAHGFLAQVGRSVVNITAGVLEKCGEGDAMAGTMVKIFEKCGGHCLQRVWDWLVTAKL